jgi:hypothetical protein
LRVFVTYKAKLSRHQTRCQHGTSVLWLRFRSPAAQPMGPSMFADQISNAITHASLAGCDQLARDLWKGFGAGVIPDDQAEALSAALEGRRRALRGEAGQPPARSQKPLWNGPSRFPPRRVQVSPDRRRSIERRRHLAASGPMPPALGSRFTTGELAVLRIVADEVVAHGVCSLTLGEIAARAGVCRSTARNAVRAAARAGLVTIEERRRPGRINLPSLIRVISREWLVWLEHGRHRREGRIGGKNLSPTVRKLEKRALKLGEPAAGNAYIRQEGRSNDPEGRPIPCLRPRWRN